MNDQFDAEDRARRAAWRVGSSFLVAMVAGIALALTYWFGGQPQLEGLLLGILLAGLGAGAVIWGHHLMPNELVVEEREELASSEADRQAVAGELGPEAIRRRRVLRWLLAGATGSALAAFLFPVRSLGPRVKDALAVTPWTRGSRAVDTEGRLIRADQLDVGSILTAFPEGYEGEADAQALLIRVDPGRLRDEVADRSADGLVAYSKLCTHLGCPVGLYQQSSHLLLCPCHQSTFDVIEGGAPKFGPAARALPQLPITVDDQGFVVALGDFTDAVGAGFWWRPRT